MTQRSYKTIARVCQRALIASSLLAVSIAAMSADLFEEGKLRPLKPGDPITATDTIGGYAIYPGDGKWQFLGGEGTQSTLLGGSMGVGSTMIVGSRMGAIAMVQVEGNVPLARQIIQANLTRGGADYWSGSPCSSDHLVVRNKGRGRDDACMTIDPVEVNGGKAPVVALEIVLTNAAGSGRYHRTSLLLNISMLGIRDTVRADWTPEAMATRPELRSFLDRLTLWAETLQDSSIKAFGYSQPQDAYAGVPSLRTLMSAPSAVR